MELIGLDNFVSSANTETLLTTPSPKSLMNKLPSQESGPKVIWVTPCSTKLTGSDSQCRIHITKPKYEYKYFQDGDIIIGGVFTVNTGIFYIPDNNNKNIPLCVNPFFDSYKDIRFFLYAVDEINKNPDLLPNITLGYHVYDPCANSRLAIGSVLQILSGPRSVVPNYSCRDKGQIAGFIGDRSTITSLPIAQLLSIYGYLQISYGDTDPVLNDRSLYPYYFNTGPSEHVQHIAIAKLVKHFGWTWVIILASSDDGGQRKSQNLKNEITKLGACVDLIGTLMEDENTAVRTLQKIQNSTAEVVIFCGGHFYQYSLLFLVEQMLNDKMWVFPVKWGFVMNYFLYNGCLLFQEVTLVFSNDNFKNIIQLNMGYNYSSHRVSRAVNGLAQAEHNMLSSSGNTVLHKITHKKQVTRLADLIMIIYSLMFMRDLMVLDWVWSCVTTW
ncbi:hypothetical protein XELAEV_18004090mg [Xenopus laevis]|uniref:Receptor ligand binding region domain-containing protein n=1 Tax=Xenopus laevis TaxID=8355 RepID=A0A974BRP0_XENLA|nr:hypothetical protein XELAEV_18004090mg [Xenopus laevis]